MTRYINKLKAKFTSVVNRSTLEIAQQKKLLESNLLLQCRTMASINREKQHIDSLSEVEFSAFSQWGEDGIIDWLINKIPSIPDKFVEFGV